MNTEKFLEKVLEDVKHFNILMGNDLETKDPDERQKYLNTYNKLTMEECNEYYNSNLEEDDAEILDAICDILYTAGAIVLIKDFKDQSWSVGLSFMVRRYKEGYYNIWWTTSNLQQLVGLGLGKGYDVEGAFDRVTESNLTKAPLLSEIEDTEKEVECILKQGRYADVSYRTVSVGGEDRVVFTAGKDLEEGSVFEVPKIVKPSTFKSVEDLGGLEEFIK